MFHTVHGDISFIFYVNVNELNTILSLKNLPSETLISVFFVQTTIISSTIMPKIGSVSEYIYIYILITAIYIIDALWSCEGVLLVSFSLHDCIKITLLWTWMNETQLNMIWIYFTYLYLAVVLRWYLSILKREGERVRGGGDGGTKGDRKTNKQTNININIQGDKNGNT